ncbi:hypothetical protein PR202_gb24534 [Eleusine coracana subsp. coracana]|uniref:Uncharacterized protein n=1 Tax=Eleusine coracana subsp. coracana TaxID=191504 RepID=A0AAV5FN63_ELECO|nr:hypothetical protein PR202_gb24534 [Eleusine coracana subsp. coracana]
MDTSREVILVGEFLPIQERVTNISERLEADFSKIDTKIHRFPPGLQGIGDRYIVPSVVALGPYHHGAPHLQKMEQVKHAAARCSCEDSHHTIEEVYAKILSEAKKARGCYDENEVAGFSEEDFAEIMFLDGCFLLEYIGGINNKSPFLVNSMVLSTGPCMLRDIMLLENQLPWHVLEALMTFKHVGVSEFIVNVIQADLDKKNHAGEFEKNVDHEVPHFLGLARLYLTSNMRPVLSHHLDGDRTTRPLSAVRLAEMGVKLKSSKVACFADMSISKKGWFFAELSVSPVFLNDSTTCWLVNMAAFETSTSKGYPSDGFHISSYLSLLAMLMDKEEDVHELRAQHIVHSFFSNQETLDFFKAIARNLRLGHRCFVISKEIEDYEQERRRWIIIHKFLYHHWRKIVTLISITSVLVGIFKTLISLDKSH